jgi:S-layer homology domain
MRAELSMNHTPNSSTLTLLKPARISRIWLRLVVLAMAASAGLFGQCTFTVTAPYLSGGTLYVDASSQTLTVLVTASSSACPWTASGNSFAALSGQGSANGNGTVAFSIAQNPTTTYADRSTTLTVAGQSVPLIQRGTVAAFSDVFPSDFYFNGANILTLTGVTAGCAVANPPAQPLPLYCPLENVTRAQMAAFLVRMITSDSNPANASQVNNFQYSTTPYFTDAVGGPMNLPDGSPNPNYSQFFKYIQKLRDLGVTSGTTTTEFSPNNTVTRDQMTKFIVLARLIDEHLHVEAPG